MKQVYQLIQKQNLPLNIKIKLTEKRIRTFYEHYQGNVYIAFSGGKDSTVLLDIARRLYPNIEAVFVDTGLEYTEIKEFVKTISNVTTIKPKMNFKEVLEKYGYPIISKNVSRYVNDLKVKGNGNQRTKDIRLGLTGSKLGTLPKKWRYLINAPFKISDKCCDIMKKSPFKAYEVKSKKHPLVGTMASDSRQRKMNYLRLGCNNFKKMIGSPLSFWVEKDIWEYIKLNKIDYCSIYDTGVTNTGCIFCMFGIHLEDKPNRFQIMKKTHPKLYNFCMDKLGLEKVLKFINIDSSIIQKQIVN